MGNVERYRDFVPSMKITKLIERKFHACMNGEHESCIAVRRDSINFDDPVDICNCKCHRD